MANLLGLRTTGAVDNKAATAVFAASETVSGIAELATQTETNAGTDDLRIVTPLKLKNALTVAQPDNIFINGAFDVWQYSTNDTGVTTAIKYVADRWYVVTVAGTLANVQRSTTVRTGALSKYSLEMVGATGVTAVNIGQRIESIYLAKYKRTIAFSGYIYNGSGSAFTPTLYAITPNAVDNFLGTVIRNGGGSGESLQSCANNAWTQVTWSADVSGYTNIDNGLGITLEIPSGSLVAGDTVRFAEMNLTPGSAFVPMAMTDYIQEFARCLRYALLLDASIATTDLGFGRKAATTQILISDNYPVPMRDIPTLTHNISGYMNSSPTTTNVGLVNLTGNAFFAITGTLTVSLSVASKTAFRLLFAAGTSWDGTLGNIAVFRIGPDVVAVLSAEL